MRRFLCVLALAAGCAGGGTEVDSTGVAAQAASPAPQAACVTVGGGELQAGLTLGLGGDIEVTGVQELGGTPVGFSVSSSAADFHYVVTSGSDSSCSAAGAYAGGKGIDRVTFCTGGSGCP
ncbi:MAG: hypothetical protein JWN44_4528 [Myxococcales bacterium]|nr:hypothetical protein [Myxococcales bacterium]